VLFLTYTTLALPARSGPGGGRKPARLDQVISWATRGSKDATTWDGVIVFDECRKSKGLKPGDAGDGGGGGGGGGGSGLFADDGGGRGGGRGGRGGAGAGTSSKVSLAVVELQARLPSARVLYTSATGVSSLADCGYLVREKEKVDEVFFFFPLLRDENASFLSLNLTRFTSFSPSIQ
jgi:hypothetical protein